MGQQQAGLITTCGPCSAVMSDWRWIGNPDEAAKAEYMLSLFSSAILDDKLRVTSHHKQGQDIDKFRTLIRDHLGINALPATYEICRAFAKLAITVKDWDGSTISNILSQVSDFHEKLIQQGLKIDNPLKSKAGRALRQRLETDYKKTSKAKVAFSIAQMKRVYEAGCDKEGFGNPGEPEGGKYGTKRRASLRRNWHHRVAITFLNAGALRMNAAAALRVLYRLNGNCKGGIEFLPGSDVSVQWDETLELWYIDIFVDADKNVKTSRRAYIPEAILALGAVPVEDFLYYLRVFGPPSGGYLFRAPNGGGSTWYPLQRNKKGNIGGFTNWSNMVQEMYQRAFPTATDKKLYGSHSGRKSLAQWLWDDGFPRRLIADVGGWFMKKDSMDLYFSTSRFVILRAITYMGMGLAGRMNDD